MSTNPYGTYARILAEVAVDAETLGDDMNAAIGIAPDASGQTADATNHVFTQNAEAMREIARAAREIATIAEDQGPADAMFAAAPTPDDVADAQQKVLDAKANGAAPEEVRKAANHAADLATEREDARNAHAAASRRTAEAMRAVVMPMMPTGSAPIPQVVRGDGDSGSYRPNTSHGGQGQDTSSSNSTSGNGGGGMPRDSSSSAGGSSLSDADAGTSLSADGAGVPMNAQQLAGQSQQMPQQGATGQPSMSPMGQMGAVPTTGAGKLTDPKALAKAAAARNRKRTNDNGTPIAPVMSPMSFGSANGGGAVDRGSSTSGVTTNANTSGSLKTALSAASVPPGTGAQPGMTAARGGGMMGGAPGAGGAGGGTTKERPTIYDAHRPDEVERSDSIQTGTLSRDTALDPNVVEERERGK